MKKEKIGGIIAIALVIFLLLGVISYVSRGFRDWNYTSWFNSQSLEDVSGYTILDARDINISADNTPNITFEIFDSEEPAFASPLGLAAVAAKSITATIAPDNAANKLVDWSIVWSTPESAFASGKAVTEYVNVIPLSNGSLTASVECYQAFADESIIITVTTRDGGFTANCFVTFVGKPDTLNIVDNFEITTIGGVDYALAGSNRTYSLDITTSNAYNSVKSGYQNYSVEVIGYGAIVVCDYNLTPSGNDWQPPESTLQLDGIKSSFVTASIVDGQLQIVTKNLVENYYSSFSGGGNSGTYFDKFKAFDLTDLQGRPYYFLIRVTELNSNIFQEIRLSISSSVTDASISPSSIEF